MKLTKDPARIRPGLLVKKHDGGGSMSSRIRTILAVLVLVLWMTATASAGKAEWRDEAYDFGGSRFILVMEPQFSYDGFDVSGKNKFSRFPYAVEKIRDLLNSKLSSLPQQKFVNLDYVQRQIQADPSLTEPYDPKAPGFAAMIQRETGKHVSLVLYLDIRDYGWFYEYHDAYTTTETTTERVYYNRKNSDGTETSGWMDVPRTKLVHHPAGYFISDSAAVEFRLFDTASSKDVWKYSDNRTRRSPAISNGYDPSGPESMMKRIFDDAFKQIPLVRKN